MSSDGCGGIGEGRGRYRGASDLEWHGGMDSMFTAHVPVVPVAERSREQKIYMAKLCAKQRLRYVHAPWEGSAKHVITCATQSPTLNLLAELSVDNRVCEGMHRRVAMGLLATSGMG